MSARQVRVTIEGPAHEIQGKSGILRLDMPADETGLSPVLMVNPAWDGVTVEDVAPVYDWTDGDVVLELFDGGAEPRVWTRHEGVWRSPGVPGKATDGAVSKALPLEAKALRYQAGDQ